MWGRRLAAAAVLAATGLVVTGFAAPSGRGEIRATVFSPSAADAAFAQGMIPHHAEAVRMSRLLLTKPGLPERVRLVAEFIAHDQQREIDEMAGWLTAWQLPAAAGMAHEHDETALRAAGTADAVPLFLREMIAHHRSGIAMARTLLAGDCRNAWTRGLAKHVINEQSAENTAMAALLADGR